MLLSIIYSKAHSLLLLCPSIVYSNAHLLFTATPIYHLSQRLPIVYHNTHLLFTTTLIYCLPQHPSIIYHNAHLLFTTTLIYHLPQLIMKFLCHCSQCSGRGKEWVVRTIRKHLARDLDQLSRPTTTGQLKEMLEVCIEKTRNALSQAGTHLRILIIGYFHLTKSC